MVITQKPSPNQDGNRHPIDRIVIHWINGTLASADVVFAKPRGASAHYGIEDGEVHQYVEESMVAYHAGNYSMNQRSIGIEHSASPDRPASEQTYKTSGQLVAEIAKRYGIPLDREHIIRHGEVVATQCCGTVDVDKIINLAKGQNTMDRRPYWFDLINKAVWNKPHEQIKDSEVELFTKEYPNQKAGNGKWSQLCNLVYQGNVDSNKITVEQLWSEIHKNCKKEELKKKVISFVQSL